jgi:hypothetical protein
MPPRLAASLLTALIAFAAAADIFAAESELAGRWILNDELTREVQPDDPKQRDLLGNLPRASVSVGGVPLPTGGGQPPPVAGSARNPGVLETAHLTIEPVGDQLRLIYAGGTGDTLKAGNDQGLISRWNRRKLTSHYETTSRKVSQVYEVRRDGRLLVTVKLNPNRGPTLVHKRVFDPVAES